MTESTTIIRVFVASPGDVSHERDSLAAVVNELNRTLAALLPERPHRLELVRWETHAFPGMGRPQGVINEQIGDYDIFVGLIWSRFGTPTGRTDSGTEEEFRLAYEKWTVHRRPRIMFYFSCAPIPPPRTQVDIDQLARIAAFRDEISRLGITWEYEGAIRFPDVIRPHLTEAIGTILDQRRASVGKSVPEREYGRLGPIRIRITEIGDRDAFRSIRADLVGKTGILLEGTRRKEWCVGTVALDEPASEHDNRVWQLSHFKFKKLDAA